jgi:hypothetical protein
LSNRRACVNVRPNKLRGRQLRKSVAAAGLIALLTLGGCQPLEVDQVAQQSMIGLSKRHILSCLGEPAQRVRAGQDTEIWTYAGGQLRGYGPQWALLLNTNLPPFGGSGTCEVKLVMTNAKVSQVLYAAADGEALPLGQECLFPVESCVRAP